MTEEQDTYPPDTVLLHDFGRGPWTPSAGPYVMKLETFLRMAKIPYKVITCFVIIYVYVIV